MVRTIIAEKKYDCKELIGKFIDERHYDLLIEEDCDVYMPPDCDMSTSANCDVPGDCDTCTKASDEKRIVFKFRKNYFSKKEQQMAYEGLREAAIITENRGLASGIKDGVIATGEGREWVTNYQEELTSAILAPNYASSTLNDEDIIDVINAKYPTDEDKKRAGGEGKNNVWVISRFRNGEFSFPDWVKSIRPMSKEDRIKSVKEILDMVSETTYGSPVNSGIAGWFDRYPRIPYGRATGYTRNNFDKFKMSFPFLKSLAKGFKEMMPKRYANQMAASKKIDPEFLVPGTPFTTITVNKTFRTAAHYDAGDFTEGLSNLLVLSNDGKFTGGYLIAPEYRIAVNVRPGDLLLINNHEVMHGNTPIVCEEGSERISLVVYFREKMLELGTKEYEDCRYAFIESRRTNKDHPLQRKLWNGVSPGCFLSDDWKDYLVTNLGVEKARKYEPELMEENTSLEDFF